MEIYFGLAYLVFVALITFLVLTFTFNSDIEIEDDENFTVRFLSWIIRLVFLMILKVFITAYFLFQLLMFINHLMEKGI